MTEDFSEEVEFDPEIDHDPNDAIDLDYDEDGDIDDAEETGNDQVEEEGEEVEGAEPVPDELAEEDIFSAENEIEEEA